MARRHRAGTSVGHRVARIEELVRGATGEEAFDLVFALVAARVVSEREGVVLRSMQNARKGLRAARRAFPWARLPADLDLAPDRLEPILGLVNGLPITEDGLDACFETLLTRVAKGQKGQYFTPRHVVDFAVRAVAPRAGERELDPACGSGAFLSRARRLAEVRPRGYDVDARAVRTARLLFEACGHRADTIRHADALRIARRPAADVVLTNPPFAGGADASGFAVARLVARAERDVLFLEACLSWLRPGGRMAMVLPHGVAAAPRYAKLRAWLADQARVLAVVSLPQETFAPHTQQRAVVLFLKRHEARARDDRTRVLFAVSERAGKDRAGDPCLPGHDLDPGVLAGFLEAEGFHA